MSLESFFQKKERLNDEIVEDYKTANKKKTIPRVLVKLQVCYNK